MSKFQVGKKYRNRNNHKSIATCEWVGEYVVVLRMISNVCGEITVGVDNKTWEEYVEPRKKVVYVHFLECRTYPMHTYDIVEDRPHSDDYFEDNLVGCKRVELVEGEFDE